MDFLSNIEQYLERISFMGSDFIVSEEELYFEELR